MLRRTIPLLTEEVFQDLFPSCQASTIEVVNHKTDTRHYVELNLTKKQQHGFYLVSIGSVVERSRAADDDCNMDWPDASKFQYLLRILQVTSKDYIPKWQQIFAKHDDDFPMMITKLRYLSTA